jgi:hypothetical protein
MIFTLLTVGLYENCFPLSHDTSPVYLFQWRVPLGVPQDGASGSVMVPPAALGLHAGSAKQAPPQ